jgi:DNA-binding NarL/FixJ family response regulator
MSSDATIPRDILIVEDDAAMEAMTLAAVDVFVGSRVIVARSIREARDVLQQIAIDLAIVDIGLPDGSGIDLLRELKRTERVGGGPAPVCVMHTVFDTDDVLFAVLGAGADGYLLKGEAPAVMATRLSAAMRHEPAISPSIARRVLALARESVTGRAPSRGSTSDGTATVSLTPREHQVLQMIAQGHTLAEVARELSTSVNTVKSQVKRVYEELDVHTRVAAAAKARRLGLLDESE